MATSQQNLVFDATTLATYKQWAKAISDFFTTAGWVLSGDTGQVNWGTIATVPSNSLTRDYEIWTPGDGLQTFYVKIRYGTNGGASNPCFDVTLSSTTNGAGTQTGFVTSTFTCPIGGGASISTVTQFMCYFSGDTGRMGILMWRDCSTANNTGFFAIQRSKNASGTDYGTSSTGYVTLIGNSSNPSNNSPNIQQSLVFGTGITTAITQNSGGSNALVVLVNGGPSHSATSQLFNGSASISPVFPDVGFFDNPMDVALVGAGSDFTEGATYVIASGNMPYGVSHTYIATKNLTRLYYQFGTPCLLLRYD